MSVYYCADLHFSHRLVAGHRGFGDNTDAHDAEIIERWSGIVRDDDIVYVLGDLAVSNPTRALAILSELPGRKRLIEGNHEAGASLHRDAPRLRRKFGYDDVFEWMSPYGKRRIAGQEVLLSHYPYVADHSDEPRYAQFRLPNLGAWLLHGHTHSTAIRTSEREIHVGWDAWRRLVSEHEIEQIIATQMELEADL